MIEYRYRFKGRDSKKRRRIAIEKLKDGVVLESRILPAPDENAWTFLVSNNKGRNTDTSNTELSEPLVNEKEASA